MEKEREKNRKIAHILAEVSKSEVICKTELRNNTGYGNSTITAALNSLSDLGLIVSKNKANDNAKGGFCINPNKVVAGISYQRMSLYARLMTLDGRIIQTAEKKLDEAHLDIVDSIIQLIESMMIAPYSLSAIGVAIALNDNSGISRALALRFSVPVSIGDSVLALGMYYRYIVKKSNINTAVLLMGKRVRASIISEWDEGMELGNLLSPIISAKKGRLVYDEILSTEAVRQRMLNKYNKTEQAFEAGVIDPEIAFYSKQLQYALGELILLIDKTVKPLAIIIAGDYITNELVKGSIEGLGENIRAETVSFGKGHEEKISGACCIALNNFLYY